MKTEVLHIRHLKIHTKEPDGVIKVKMSDGFESVVQYINVEEAQEIIKYLTTQFDL